MIRGERRQRGGGKNDEIRERKAEKQHRFQHHSQRLKSLFQKSGDKTENRSISVLPAGRRCRFIKRESVYWESLNISLLSESEQSLPSVNSKDQRRRQRRRQSELKLACDVLTHQLCNMNLTSKAELAANGSYCQAGESKAPVSKVQFFKGCCLTGITSERAVLFACKIHRVHSLTESDFKFIICKCINNVRLFSRLKYAGEQATMLNLEQEAIRVEMLRSQAVSLMLLWWRERCMFAVAQWAVIYSTGSSAYKLVTVRWKCENNPCSCAQLMLRDMLETLCEWIKTLLF